MPDCPHWPPAHSTWFDYEGRSWWSAISYQSKRTRSMTANCRIGRRELAEGDATPLLP